RPRRLDRWRIGAALGRETMWRSVARAALLGLLALSVALAALELSLEVASGGRRGCARSRDHRRLRRFDALRPWQRRLVSRRALAPDRSPGRESQLAGAQLHAG